MYRCKSLPHVSHFHMYRCKSLPDFMCHTDLYAQNITLKHKPPHRKRLAATENAAAERDRQNEKEKKDLCAQLDKEKATSLVWQQSAEKSAAALESTKNDLANSLQVLSAHVSVLILIYCKRMDN